MKRSKRIAIHVIAVYLFFNLFNMFFVHVSWVSPMYVVHNLRSIEQAAHGAATNNAPFGKTQVLDIVSTQNWNDTPWPYVVTVSGSETNWTVVAQPKKRPMVILLNAILFWDLHNLDYPTHTLNSDYVMEAIYPSGLTFRDGQIIAPNQASEAIGDPGSP